MLLVYENKDKGISAEWKKTVHMPPHLHEAIEGVYVTNGNIALGVGMELYNMDEGDFAIVFPNVIHHYQVFDEKENKAIFLYIDPAVLSGFLKELQIYSPKNPVLKKENVHPDVVHAIKFLMQNPECTPILAQAYAQIILAFDLGISKYVLSRMFAKTFHCNFSKYLNGVRLNYAVGALENTQDTITNICLECGFESQRTFNRVFKERYKITPREYRKRLEIGL